MPGTPRSCSMDLQVGPGGVPAVLTACGMGLLLDIGVEAVQHHAENQGVPTVSTSMTASTDRMQKLLS